MKLLKVISVPKESYASAEKIPCSVCWLQDDLVRGGCDECNSTGFVKVIHCTALITIPSDVKYPFEVITK